MSDKDIDISKEAVEKMAEHLSGTGGIAHIAPFGPKGAEMLRAQAAQIEALTAAVDKDLSARMEAGGMIPLDAMTKPNALTRFIVHAGMTDLAFYAKWLERKAKEYGRMQAAHQTGEYVLEDDMFQFILGKAGAFSEALENYRAAEQREDDTIKDLRRRVEELTKTVNDAFYLSRERRWPLVQSTLERATKITTPNERPNDR